MKLFSKKTHGTSGYSLFTHHPEKNNGRSIRNPSVTGSCSWIHRWFMTTTERHRAETDSPWAMLWSLRASETWRTFLEMFDTWKMKRNKEHCPPSSLDFKLEIFFSMLHESVHCWWKKSYATSYSDRFRVYSFLFDEREHNFLLQKLQRKQNLNHQQKKDNQTKILDWS